MIDWPSVKARLERQKEHLRMEEGSKVLPVVLTATNFSTHFFLKQDMLMHIEVSPDASARLFRRVGSPCGFSA
jgi:tRNA(Phe) wybutosine-synthesizing methylase Tyw3